MIGLLCRFFKWGINILAVVFLVAGFGIGLKFQKILRARIKRVFYGNCSFSIKYYRFVS